MVMLGIIAASSASAQPNLATSTVPNVIVSPGGGLPYQITIRDPAGLPVPGVLVTLAWGPAAAGMTCFCPGQFQPVAAPTNAAGVATFAIAGGGCIDPAIAGAAITVTVGGVFFTAVGQVSPDWVNLAGNPIPDCSVGLGDAVTFSSWLARGAYTYCADINSDGRVGLADAVLVTPFIARSSRC
jgi:hypothetical protein